MKIHLLQIFLMHNLISVTVSYEGWKIVLLKLKLFSHKWKKLRLLNILFWTNITGKASRCTFKKTNSSSKPHKSMYFPLNVLLSTRFSTSRNTAKKLWNIKLLEYNSTLVLIQWHPWTSHKLQHVCITGIFVSGYTKTTMFIKKHMHVQSLKTPH